MAKNKYQFAVLTVMQTKINVIKAPRIMITGSNGFVGARTVEKYPSAIIVPSELTRNPDEKLISFVCEHQPNVIINAAAISDIGECEKAPDASYTANVKLPALLAEASVKVGARLLSFSSDQVYTACTHDGPYREDDILPPPKNIYARHKLEAEGRVLDIAPDSILLRATWMYDMPKYNHKNRGNFLVNTLSSVIRREKMSFSNSVYRGITYVRQVVAFLDKMQSLPGGVYNYGSENPLGMYDTAAALLDAFGIDGLKSSLLEKNTSAAHNLWMSTEKLKKLGVAFDDTASGFLHCAQDYFGFIL